MTAAVHHGMACANLNRGMRGGRRPETGACGGCTAKEIQALVREADVQIYAMGVFEPSLNLGLSNEEVSGPRLLAEIAEQTGGRAFSATEGTDLPGVATRIGIELRNQYVLAYQPMNQHKDGKYRRVEVRVNAQPGLPPLKVHWRLGYYAPQ